MFVAELAELPFPPFPPPPPLVALLNRTAVPGTSSITPLSPRATAGTTTIDNAAASKDSARRLPTILRMFPPFWVVISGEDEPVMTAFVRKKTPNLQGLS